jgi:hypothetical protein
LWAPRPAAAAVPVFLLLLLLLLLLLPSYCEITELVTCTKR